MFLTDGFLSSPSSLFKQSSGCNLLGATTCVPLFSGWQADITSKSAPHGSCHLGRGWTKQVVIIKEASQGCVLASQGVKHGVVKKHNWMDGKKTQEQKRSINDPTKMSHCGAILEIYACGFCLNPSGRPVSVALFWKDGSSGGYFREHCGCLWLSRHSLLLTANAAAGIGRVCLRVNR